MRKWTDEQLIAAVETSNTMSDVIRKIGLSVTAAGNRGTIKKHIERLNLDTSHWLGQSWVSDKKRLHPKYREIESILVENSDYKTSHLLGRLLKADLKTHQCESCKLTHWLEQPIALEVDHINGVPNDHRIENLRLLCPNCHAQTPTWRGRKNKMA